MGLSVLLLQRQYNKIIGALDMPEGLPEFPIDKRCVACAGACGWRWVVTRTVAWLEASWRRSLLASPLRGGYQSMM